MSPSNSRRSLIAFLAALSCGCAGHARSLSASGKDAPTSWQLSAEADEALGRKDYAGCGLLRDRAAALDPAHDSDLPYNAACCWALGGDRDHALASLRHSLDEGFRDPQGLAADGDLASLHRIRAGRPSSPARSRMPTTIARTPASS